MNAAQRLAGKVSIITGAVIEVSGGMTV